MQRAWCRLSRAWDLVGADLPVFSLAAFLTVALSLLTLFILAAPLMTGLCIMFGEKIRGQTPTLAHLWEGVTTRFPASIYVWVLCMLIAMPFDVLTSYLMDWRSAGAVLGLLPLLVSLCLAATVAFFCLPLIADRDLAGLEAIRCSWAMLGRDWLGASAMAVLCTLTALFGLFACGMGIIITLPVAVGAQMLAYHELPDPT